MTSCTILISHFESLPFLNSCIRQIRKYKHPEINQMICICDQSGGETCNKILEKYKYDLDIILIHTKPLYSGYGIDFTIRGNYIKTDYVCQIHVDAFPISSQWLCLPIKLIEENNFSFVGQLHFINYDSPTYPPVPFFSMSPTFNVSRTETYKEMSLEAGFTRFHNRPQSGLKFKNNDWDIWAEDDYEHKGSDDDTVAFCWESKFKDTDKLGLSVSSFIETSYARIIDDLVFHFGSCREAIWVMNQMPERYKEFTQRINENYSDELIEEMVNESMQHPTNQSRIVWDGKSKTHSSASDELNKRIEELKNE